MWLTFWLTNIHFVLEFLGAVIFFALSWLAFDTFLIKKDTKTFSKSLGFLFVAVWLTIHSLSLTNDLILLLGALCYFLGLLFILLNVYRERADSRPGFELVLVLPAVMGILWQVHMVASIMLLVIAVLSLRQYQKESKKALMPFWVAFLVLAASSVLAVFNARATDSRSLFWVLEHVLKILGFGFLGYWGWQYLKARIKEELLLVFVGMGLLIAVIVTFTFSAILLKNMESEAKANLVSNVRVIDYTFSRMKQEAASDAQVFARDERLREGIISKNFALLDELSQQLMAEKSMDFLTIADEAGEVILRAHSVTAKGDNIKGEKAGAMGLGGVPYVTIESAQATGLSIRGAAPIYDTEKEIIGVVITGFIIDNAFADQLKKNTGLEATIYQEDKVQATTIFDETGKTRNVGAKQTDEKVLEDVLKGGKGIVVETAILSRPYLASYLPLLNTEGEIIGMLQASRPQIELSQTASATSRLTLSVTLIVVIIILLPAYLVLKRITAEL